MTFIVADGTTNLETATSYTSISFADNYFSNNPDWPKSLPVDDPDFDQDLESQKQDALNRATQGVDLMYCDAFIGSQLNPEIQLLEWPRSFVKYGAIPLNLQKAICEYALDLFNGGEQIREMNIQSVVSERSIEGVGFKKSEKYSDTPVTEYRSGMLKVEMFLKKLTNDLDDSYAPAFLNW